MSGQLALVWAEHPALLEAFKNDATVYAWFQQELHGRCTLEEAYIGIIINLVAEKKKLFDEVVELSVKTNKGGTHAKS
jgi:hypothetical protein